MEFLKEQGLDERIPLVNKLISLAENIENKEYLEAVGNGAEFIGKVLMAIATKGRSLSAEALAELEGYTAEQLQEAFFEHGGGKHDKHANKDRKESARKGYNEVKEEHKQFKSETHNTPGRKKELKKLEKQQKHFQKKKNFKGENHSRNAKGK